MASSKSAAFAGGRQLLRRGTFDQARLAWRLMRDARVSSLKYAIPALLVAYLVSPVDAIPDVLLGIGQTDDVGVAVLAVMLLLRAIPMLAPPTVVREHLHEMGLVAPLQEPGRDHSDPVIDARFSVRR